jgi:exopolysaccharide production protein ExoZ
MNNSQRRPKLLGVQYLRAAAAIMVAYLHLEIQLPQFSQFLVAHGLIDSGRLKSGVDIFFVISGFIMYVTSREVGPGEFAARRIIRIVPLYWMLTLGLALALYLQPQLFRTTVLSVQFLLKSLFFIPYPNPGQNGDLAPLLVPGWTLNFEMFFYLIFTAVLFFRLRYRLVLSGLIFLIFYALGNFAAHDSSHSLWVFYGSGQIFEFWLGMFIGHFYLQDRLRIPRSVSFVLIVVGFALLLLNYQSAPAALRSLGDGVLGFLVPSTAIVLGVVALERSGTTAYHWLPALLGDASYSLYLGHIFFLGFARALWPRLPVPQSGAVAAIAFALFSLALTLAGAVLLYKLAEKPLLTVLQAAYKRYRPSPSVHQAPA